MKIMSSYRDISPGGIRNIKMGFWGCALAVSIVFLAILSLAGVLSAIYLVPTEHKMLFAVLAGISFSSFAACVYFYVSFFLRR